MRKMRTNINSLFQVISAESFKAASANESKRSSISEPFENEIIPRSIHALVDKKTKEFITKVFYKNNGQGRDSWTARVQVFRILLGPVPVLDFKILFVLIHSDPRFSVLDFFLGQVRVGPGFLKFTCSLSESALDFSKFIVLVRV